MKIKDIKENLFRKELGNYYDEEQIKKIIESFKMSDFGKDQRFEVRQKDNGRGIFDYELVYGHHRLEALRRSSGDDYEVEVIVRDYDDEKMLVELIRENLIRDHDWYLKMLSLALAKKFLSEKLKKSISSREIIKFLSRDELLFSDREAHDLLSISENLAPELLAKIKKIDSTYAVFTDEDLINLTQAKTLASFKDINEQKDLANALKNSIVHRTHEQLNLLSEYRKASNDIKTKIRSGDIDLVAVKNFSIDRKERKEFSKIVDEKKKILSANQEALYIYSCLADAIKSIQKLNLKKLDERTKHSLNIIYKKTIRVLTEYLKKEEKNV